MSCTNWSVGGTIWNNGDDVADWSASTITEANNTGRALVDYRYPSGNLKQYVPATSIIVVVQSPDPGANSSLQLISGTLGGQSISPSNRTITVSPGASLAGSFLVQVNSAWASNAVMAMGWTPSWGSHSASYHDLGGFSTPVSGLQRTVNVNLSAPSTPGTYYITTAFRGEFTSAQVMSCTNWAVGTVYWDNGDDIADWTAATVAEANNTGRAYVDYRISSGTVKQYVPATSIIVVVLSNTDPGSTSTLQFISGNLGGQNIDSATHAITVSPGASLSGSYTVEINSNWSSNAVMAMGWTTSWGAHSSSYHDLGSFATPVSGLRRTVNINITAPTTPGAYYITTAFRGEFTAAQVMSSTNWAVGSILWDNGDDVADWSANTISEANNTGRAYVDYRLATGSAKQYVPATAIIVVVSGPVQPTGALKFVPFTPCRVMETRQEYNFQGRTGPFGPPYLNRGETRTLNLSGSICQLPSSARAYVLNVTLIPRSTVNFATVWPAGESRPDFWTVRSLDGQIVANSAIVKSGGGSINVYTSDDADVLIDVSGYFSDRSDGANLVFYPLNPCRVIDTRIVYRPVPGPFGPPSMAAKETRRFHLPSTPYCNVPSGAAAYSITLTVSPPGALPYMTVWPAGGPQPVVSSINSFAGRILANNVIVPANDQGSIDVYANNDTDFLMDINGYFAPDDGQRGLYYYPVTQCRVSNTANYLLTGAFGGPAFGDNTTRTIPLQSSGCSGIAGSAKAYALNVTAMPNGNPMPYLTAWPTGQQQPIASILNAFQGQVVSSGAIIPAGNEGSVDIYTYRRTDVAVEISGYFAR
ncbi:MAG: hypothetical protein IT167_27265 [Bryobacterales bacterium]|nr:hypothetical protein [Bryobacterales bacterium]